MSNRYPTNHNLSRNNRRARVAALVSSLPGVLGGGVVAGATYEATHAQSAVAAEQVSKSHESQTPSQFIASIDKRLNDLRKKMPGKPIPLAKLHLQGVFGNAEFIDVGMPDPGHRGKVDVLSMLYNKDLKKVLIASIANGVNSADVQKVALSVNGSGEESILLHVDNNFKYNPGGVSLSIAPKLGGIGQFYSVGTNTYSNPRAQQVNFATSQATVVKEVNGFFAEAQQIIDHHQ